MLNHRRNYILKKFNIWSSFTRILINPKFVNNLVVGKQGAETDPKVFQGDRFNFFSLT